MRETTPLYEMAVGPKVTWPINQEGTKIGIHVIRKGSGLIVTTIPIDIYSQRGHADALKLARYLVSLHNTHLAKHRREQARAKATHLKLIQEKRA